MNNFTKMKNEGELVQMIVKNHLTSRRNHVIDVSQIKDYQKRDIDFIVVKDGKKTTLEVKKDKSLFKTGNIFVECGCQRGNFFSSGWVNYCEADYICYYDTTAARGIIVNRQNLLSLLELGKVITFYDKYDDKQRTAILIPLKEVRKHNFVIYEWSEKDVK